jgi:phosphatidate cytidylyltransferase
LDVGSRASGLGDGRNVLNAAPLEAGAGHSTSSRGVGLAKRVGSALLFLPFFVWLVGYAPSWAFSAFVILVGAVGQWEFTRMFIRSGCEAHPRLGLFAGSIVTASFAVPGSTPLALSMAVVGLVSAGVARGRAGGPDWRASALTLMGVCYVNWLVGHALWLRSLPYGANWIFLLVWVTWVGESAAYFVGWVAGRHKLAPTVSPAKTIEGALAQLVASPLAALVGRWWFFPDCPVAVAASAGLLLGVVGQVGDLAESYLKRSARAKDTGSLIPGHGGMLDRLDGLLFNTPALFYYVSLVGGGGTR